MGKGKSGCATGAVTWAPETADVEQAPLLAPVPFFSGKDWMDQQAQHINKLCEELRDNVEQYAQSDEGWRNWLEMQAHIHVTSWNNNIWRYLQLEAKNQDDPNFDPYALSLPASRWAKLGRTVKKQHQRYKLKPAEDDRYAATQLMPVTIWVDEKDPDTGKVIVLPNGKNKRKKITLPGRFQCYTAYHLDATEGKPLPEDPWKYTTGSEEDAELLRTHLEQACEIEGVKVLYEKSSGRARGTYEPATKTIRIDPDLPTAEQASVFLHEFIHHVAGDAAGRGKDELSREAKEIATQSTAHVILTRYKLQDRDMTFPYLASWTKGEGAKISQLNLEIQRRCRRFFEAVDPVLRALASTDKPATT